MPEQDCQGDLLLDNIAMLSIPCQPDDEAFLLFYLNVLMWDLVAGLSAKCILTANRGLCKSQTTAELDKAAESWTMKV